MNISSEIMFLSKGLMTTHQGVLAVDPPKPDERELLVANHERISKHMEVKGLCVIAEFPQMGMPKSRIAATLCGMSRGGASSPASMRTIRFINAVPATDAVPSLGDAPQAADAPRRPIRPHGVTTRRLTSFSTHYSSSPCGGPACVPLLTFETCAPPSSATRPAFSPTVYVST
jgi:hypothetical protein